MISAPITDEGFHHIELTEINQESFPPSSPVVEGRGPGMLGRVLSVAATAGSYVKELLLSSSVISPRDDLDPLFVGMLERLSNTGRMLNNIDLTLFFQGLNNKLKEESKTLFSYTLEFINSPITTRNLDEAKEAIERINPLSVIVIPFVLGGGSMLEINHITVLMIKDGVVAYYDSKGVISEYRPIKENNLRAVVDFCRDRWAGGAEIKQNITTHQWDINTCGLRVAQFVYNRIDTGRALDDFSDEGNIGAFRQTFFNTALLAFKE